MNSQTKTVKAKFLDLRRPGAAVRRWQLDEADDSERPMQKIDIGMRDTPGRWGTLPNWEAEAWTKGNQSRSLSKRCPTWPACHSMCNLGSYSVLLVPRSLNER